MMINVRELVMFCGSVQSKVLCVSWRRFLVVGFNIFRAWIVSLLCLVVISIRMTLALCLILSRIT